VLGFSVFSSSKARITGAYNLIFNGNPTMPNIDTFGYTDASFYGTYLTPNHPLYDATTPTRTQAAS
jgi:hypothetical protein